MRNPDAPRENKSRPRIFVTQPIAESALVHFSIVVPPVRLNIAPATAGSPI